MKVGFMLNQDRFQKEAEVLNKLRGILTSELPTLDELNLKDLGCN